jgi:hypothetical protein
MTMTTGFIYDLHTGHNTARLTSDGDIYWYDPEQDIEKKIGTATRDGQLCDLDGKFTGLHLRDVHDISFSLPVR